jgi:hypothetical protein
MTTEQAQTDTTETTAASVDAAGSMLDLSKITATDAETDADDAKQTVQMGQEPAEKKGDADQPGQKMERPEWLKEDKFWDAEKGELKSDLLFKNYQELNAKFSRGDHKAPDKPEGYKVNISDDSKALLFGAKDADPHKDPLFQKAAEWGVKNKIPQGAMDEFIELYAEATAGEAGKYQIDVKAERQALGKNADAILQNQHEFFTQMYKNGEIGEAELKEAGILFETAAGVKLMQAIRSKYGEQSIPTDPSPNMDGVPSSDELAQMRLSDKYEKDAAYRAKVDGYYSKRYGDKPAMSSITTR